MAGAIHNDRLLRTECFRDRRKERCPMRTEELDRKEGVEVLLENNNAVIYEGRRRHRRQRRWLIGNQARCRVEQRRSP